MWSCQHGFELHQPHLVSSAASNHMPDGEDGCETNADSSSPVMCGTVLSLSCRQSDASSSTNLEGGCAWLSLQSSIMLPLQSSTDAPGIYRCSRPTAYTHSHSRVCSSGAWQQRAAERLSDARQAKILQ